MKKKFIRATFVTAIAMVCGINVFNAQKSETLSDIALANVEALAELESDMPGVGTTGSCTEVCYKHDGCVLEYTMVKPPVVYIIEKNNNNNEDMLCHILIF